MVKQLIYGAQGVLWLSLLERNHFLMGKIVFIIYLDSKLVKQILSVTGLPSLDVLETNKIGSVNTRENLLKIKVDKIELRDKYINVSNECVELLCKLLEFDPVKRISAEDALKSDFFKNYELEEVEQIDHSFDFKFEDKIYNEEEIRKEFLEEILLYHDINVLEKYLLIKNSYNEHFHI